jgi:ribosomal protein S18 acetylase RimI-like enzyme
LQTQNTSALIPDTPENLEMLGLLTTGACVSGRDSSHLVVWKQGGKLIVIKGRPEIEFIKNALHDADSDATILLRQTRLDAWDGLFRGWHARRAFRCVQGDSHPVIPGGVWFSPSVHGSLLSRMPASYREELLEGHSAGKVALSLEAGSIASYCFPAWVTPGHFDLNVVTLPEFQCKGHARTCCSLLLSHFAESGRRAQWFTERANRPSLALSRRLGFQPFESVLLLRHQPGVNHA